jgi:serine/threonine protein kinase/tetratricopeptide (TPR) repeat protein
MALSPGSRLGPYEIVGLLGSGGMGEVYRARDPRLSREVAIKVLPEELSSDPDRLQRFEKEARTASSLNHPGIVTVYDIGRSGADTYLVMELVEGRTLRELLVSGPLPIQKTLQVASQVADGLARAHEAGIVHRDLKPENVMVRADGFAKILDFGLAKLTEAQTAGGGGTQVPTAAPGTQTGVILGTVGYMSPEQASGRAVDFRSDQFSFGAILYEMAAGERPFAGASGVETLAAILRDEPRPLASANPKAPASLCRIVARCISKDREERYGSTQDLAHDLRSLRDQLTTAPEPETVRALPPRAAAGRPRAALPIAGVFLLGLLAAGAWWLSRSGEKTPPPSERARSIAVLPLENLGGGPEDEYFADGMTESLITDLARVPGMLVIARNSVFRYKGRKTDLEKIGNELDVNYVLEGSVQRAGGRVRIHAKLIDVASGFHLWADRYDRSLEDVFALQDDISEKVAGALRIELARSGEGRRATVPTNNLAAYDAYLRGRYLFQTSPGDAGHERAIAMFERAVSLDPRFALARAALASGYVERLFRRDPSREWEKRALAEIETALSLDPNLAEAYLAREHVIWTRLNGFPHERAAKDVRRALAINPGFAEAHSDLAAIYLHVGLLDKAEAEAKLARRLDPFERWNSHYLVSTYLFARKYDLALAEVDSQESVAVGRRHPWKALALVNLGRSEEAFDYLELILGMDPKDPSFQREMWEASLGVHALLLARAGDHPKAEEYIARTIASDRGLGHFHHSEYHIGSAYAVMGRTGQAVEWLRKSAENGFPCYPLFASDPNLASLRGDADYQALMREMKADWERYRVSL